jgi:WD40 repeat protein
VVPGELARSHLFQLLTAKDPDDRMPQKDDPLPAAQIALLERWIKDGAKFDGPDPKKPFASFSATGPQPDPPASYVRPVPVLALAFGGDGKELAAGGYHEITIWDAANGTLLRRIKNVAQQTQALAFSPGGALLAAASGTPGKIGEVKLFNPGTGALLQTLVTGGDIMLALAFSPDGQQLATAGSDNTVRLFDVATGQQLFAVEQHADWVLGLAFSPDGGTIASASRDKTARLLGAKTGELEQTYAGHSGAVFDVAFSGDGKRVFSASRDKEIHIWDVKDAKKIAEIGGFDGEVVKLCASSNQVFSICTDRLARQHSIAGKKTELVRTLEGHADVIYSLALHQPTHRLATGSFDGEVRVWDADSGTQQTNFIAAPGYRNRNVSSAR